MSDARIRDAINIITGNNLADKVYAIDATVISVDEGKRTAEVQVVSGKANNTITARLMSSKDDGLLIIPTVDSTVCVILSDFTAPYISQYSGIDKIIFKGGDLGGLVKVVSLTDRLNKIEQDNNDLKQVFSSWVPVPNDGGAALKTAAATWAGSTLSKTQQADIENKKITHGQ